MTDKFAVAYNLPKKSLQIKVSSEGGANPSRCRKNWSGYKPLKLSHSHFYPKRAAKYSWNTFIHPNLSLRKHNFGIITQYPVQQVILGVNVCFCHSYLHKKHTHKDTQNAHRRWKAHALLQSYFANPSLHSDFKGFPYRNK